MKKTLITLFILLIFNSSQAGWFDKKIKVENCYPKNEYSSLKDFKKREGNEWIWEWEINLKENTAVQTVKGSRIPLRLYKHDITMKTERFIVVSDHKTPDTKFNLKNETVIAELDGETWANISPSDRITIHQCEFN